MLGIGFLSPAIIAASIFFLLPVLLTVVFAFTNMSTSTGIMGGDYRINTEQLRSVDETGISTESVEKLETAGFQITEAGLTALADQFGDNVADELREGFLGESFTARRDLERVLRQLDEPIRQTRDRKAAADLFAVTIIGERFDTEDQFRAALGDTGIDPADHDALT
jgi:inositol-phosphate transport system permease protein